MTPEAVLDELKRRGAHVEVVGDKLRCRAPVGVLTPELRQALAEHKAALLRLLTPATRAGAQDDHGDDHLEPPCPRCGASDWRDTPDAGRWCYRCVVEGRDPVVAVKVHSAVLNEAIWVMADGLPREQWPQDGATVYTLEEIRVLREVGPDHLQWVHPLKELFGAKVVSARQHPPRASDDEPGIEEKNDGAGYD